MSASPKTAAGELPDASELQLDRNGRLRHLLTLRGLSRDMLVGLLDQAESYLSPMDQPVVRSNALRGRTVANLFFEPSTRTRASFELAAKRLGADVLNLDVNMSSRKKGESVLDTIYTLQAMQIDVFVVRDAGAGITSFIARHVHDHVSVLNGGEAHISHPTQGLLDLLTMRQAMGRFEDLKVVIVGDIAHSRVARSAAEGLQTLGVGELCLVSPDAFAPSPADFPGATLTHDLDNAIRGANVVMALRIQRERIGSYEGIPSIDEYYMRFGVTHERMRMAAKGAIVMHPGPMNRGIEIESSLADGSQSRITRQVTNGVAVRMAVLAAVMSAREQP